MPDDHFHYSIYSPPFGSLYTYSNSERDMGNSRDWNEFWQHYRFSGERTHARAETGSPAVFPLHDNANEQAESRLYRRSTASAAI